MAVCEIHLNSQDSLGKMTSFMAILPEGMPGPFPVLYLLHGLSDDHTAWTRRTSIERHLNNMPMIVVMPNGERSWYTNAVTNSKAAFETFIVRDLIGFVDQTFQTIPTRAGRAVAGLSMGGYGAAKLALKYPKLFCASIAWSGALGDAHTISEDSEWKREVTAIFGPNQTGGENDVLALATKSDKALLPALRIDCGTEDFLINQNRQFHTHLDTLDIPHEYLERPGGHGWDYWDSGIENSLPFLKKAFGLLE